jgi:hypothetical protein
MIKQARLYQDSLEELYVKEHWAGPYILIMAETYRLCCLSHCAMRTCREDPGLKGASGVAKTHDFKFCNRVEPQRPPAPAPNEDARQG